MSQPNLPIPSKVERPDASIINTGQVPNDVYTVLFTNGEVSTSGKGQQQICGSFEIISPDLAELPNGQKSSVAGKKGRMYMSIDPTATHYQLWYEAFGRLNLLDDEKNIKPAEIVAKLKSRKVFAYVCLDSEERVQRKPKRPGQDVGDIIYHPITKKPLTSGWDFKYIGAENVIGLDPSGGMGAAAAAAENRPY